jgi:ubiquinone/menaquinone biosynthesis C-methylase UbiE
MYGYERVQAEYYDYTSKGLEGDLQFYLDEAKRSGSPVLELGCGTGRILIPIAEAGIDIVGLDLSDAMLSVAQRKIASLPTSVQERIELVEGDMRAFSLGRKFKLITIPYRAFLHLMTPEDQKAALRTIHEHLDADGCLVFNIFDPRVETIAAHLVPLGRAVKKLMEFARSDNEHRVIVSESRRYDTEQQVLTEDRIFEELDEGGEVISKAYAVISLRYAFRYEMQHLLELCGYNIDALYGDFERGPFRSGNEQIWVARKEDA